GGRGSACERRPDLLESLELGFKCFRAAEQEMAAAPHVAGRTLGGGSPGALLPLGQVANDRAAGSGIRAAGWSREGGRADARGAPLRAGTRIEVRRPAMRAQRISFVVAVLASAV